MKRHSFNLLSVTLATMFITGIVFPAPQAFARFLENDADQIDQEERLGLETYNDLLSYRYPVSAYLKWDEFDTGFRVNAGSLNANRFLYAQDIKLQVNRGEAGSLRFTQERREDVTSQRTESEIRATIMPFDKSVPIEFSILGDSGTFKEYGDLGLALGYFGDRRHFVEVFYWSVDHYYDTKKSDLNDLRDKRAWSIGLRNVWAFSDDVSLASTIEYEVPFTWDRKSRGYAYEYQRQSASLRVLYGQKTSGLYEMSLTGESKRESKDWRGYEVDPMSEYKKSLKRQALFGELSWYRVGGATGVDYEVGGAVFLRQANYDHIFPEGVQDLPGPDGLMEEPSPNSRRTEQALFGSINKPIGDELKHRFQYGAHANNVYINERDGFRNIEVKAQAAWEYRYSEKASAFLNTSWDIDQLAKDFPYNQGNFRPWGGGNMQFTAVF